MPGTQETVNQAWLFLPEFSGSHVYYLSQGKMGAGVQAEGEGYHLLPRMLGHKNPL